MSRDVPYEEEAICDRCGAIGAFDFMGEYFCPTCASKALPAPPQDTREIEK